MIGFGSPNKSGKASSHGAPLGEEEISLVRKKLKWKSEPFVVPEQILNTWREIGKKGAKLEDDWQKKLSKTNSTIKSDMENILLDKNINNLEELINSEKTKYFESKPSMATRQCSASVIDSITNVLPELIGGSADLSGSNNTKTNSSKIISSKNFKGNYIHYGVREHGMAAIMNGLALYNGLIPFGGTFLIFSDYCKPSIRLSALMGLRVIYIFSHDSIGLGEDGPTHQPIEQLSGLRAIPNLNVFRPADMNETLECWEIALKNKNTPSVIALSRQKLKYISKSLSKENKSALGAYVVNLTSHDCKVIILASGSEVEIAMEAQKSLKENNIDSKVVSVPCQELFDLQTEEYKKEILEEDTLIVSIEAGGINCWHKYISNKGISLGVDSFGKSAPYKEIYNEFDLTSEKIVSLVQKMLRN